MNFQNCRYIQRVCKVLVTVRRGRVSPPEQNLYAGEETSPLRTPRFPNPPQSLIIIEHTPLNITVSTKTLHTPHSELY